MAFLHWQKRHPVIDEEALKKESYFITPTKLIAKEIGIPSREEINRFNPPLTEKQKKEQDKEYFSLKIKQFLNTSLSQKIIWLRQKWYFFCENKAVIESKKR